MQACRSCHREDRWPCGLLEPSEGQQLGTRDQNGMRRRWLEEAFSLSMMSNISGLYLASSTSDEPHT